MRNKEESPVISFFFQVVLGCILYSIISYKVLGPSVMLGLTDIQLDIRSFAISSSKFLLMLAVPLFIGLCIAKIPRSNRRKPIGLFLTRILVITWVLAMALLYSGWHAQKRVLEHFTATDNVQIASGSKKIKPIKAFTFTQNSHGVSEANFDQSALAGFESWIIDGIIKKSRTRYAELGFNLKEFRPKLDSNSGYVFAGGKKLGIIKLRLDNKIRHVTIFGVKGDELVRVSCIRASNHDIPVWSGECGNEIYKTFGVRLQL